MESSSQNAAESKLSLQHQMCWQAFAMLELHSMYSAFKFYGSKHIPPLADWRRSSFFSDLQEKKTFMEGVKKLSITLGALGQVCLVLGCVGLLPGSTASSLAFLVAVSFGTAHFYSMEIDFKKILQVRPYAYLPFPLAAVAICTLLWNVAV